MRWSFRQTSSTLRPERGRCGAADSLAMGHGGLRGSCLALVPLFGMLLTVHHIPDPKVTSHHEVKTAICASVALRVAVLVIRDAHSHCAVERWMQSDSRQTTWQQAEMIFLISIANQLWSLNRFEHHGLICILKKKWKLPPQQRYQHVLRLSSLISNRLDEMFSAKQNAQCGDKFLSMQLHLLWDSFLLLFK